jgi:glycosyltransferase involved in cell wall biosynthesis
MKLGFQGRFLSHPYTGIGQYTRGLLREFGDADHFRSLEVFVPTLPDAQDLDFGPQVHVAHAVSRRLDHRALGAVSGAFSPRLKRHFFEQHAAMNFFRKQKVDLVHFPYPAHPFRPLEIPSIVTVHDVIPWIFPDYASGVLSSLAHRFARHNIHLATHLVTVSQFSKREIMRVCGISEKKISVIHNGCSPVYGEVAQQRGDLSHQLPENLRGKPYILYVGGYDRRKNVELLLQSFERFLKVEPEATLVLVGKPAHASSLYDVPSLGRVRNVFRTDFFGRRVTRGPLSLLSFFYSSLFL